MITDCIYQSDNDLEIPLLRLDRQASSADIPFVCYGEQSRTYKMNGNGTLHFYTDDYRYPDLYEHPEKILNHNPRNIVEPNFSLFADTPIAFGMKAVYQKRWIARAMQEEGINVFVDLNVNSKFYKLNLLGVPMGWKSFCTRGYHERLHYLEYEYNIAHDIADSDQFLFVIYGGGHIVKRWAHEHNCIYVNPMIDLKKNYHRALKKIDESVAFAGGELDPTKLLQSATERFKLKQVEDYRTKIEEICQKEVEAQE